MRIGHEPQFAKIQSKSQSTGRVATSEWDILPRTLNDAALQHPLEDLAKRLVTHGPHAKAAHGVGAGDAVYPSAARRALRASAAPAVATTAALSDLTPRELEVLTLLAGSLSNAEIAADLTVSDVTIKTHVARVLMKLGVRDRVQAIMSPWHW